MSTYVLGLSAFYHDAAACLIRDGEIVLALEEERLSRVKHDHAYPARAVAACLDAAGIAAAEVDAVVFYEKTLPKLERQLDTWIRGFPGSFAAFVRSMARYLDGRLDLAAGSRSTAVSAARSSSPSTTSRTRRRRSSPRPSRRPACSSPTASGSGSTTSVWSAGQGGIAPEREVRFPDSLGLFYSLVTAHLGFRVNEDEYKVMGLAAYGEDRFAREMAALLPFEDDGAFRLERRFVDPAGEGAARDAPRSARSSARRAPRGAPIEERHRNLARSAQVRLEEALLRLEATLPAGKPLCLAGGVALNGAANARLARRRPLFVPFAPGDSGAAIGAAYVGWFLAGLGGGAPCAGRRRPSSGRRSTRRPAPRPRAPPGSPRGRSTRSAATRSSRSASRAARSSAGSTGAWSSARGLSADDPSSQTRAAPTSAMSSMLASNTASRFRPFAPAVLEERAAEFFEEARARCPG